MTKNVTKAILFLYDLLKKSSFCFFDSFKLTRQFAWSPSLLVQRVAIALILGIFVITSAGDAWAVTQNTAADKSVTNYRDINYVKKGATKISDQEALKKAEQKVTTQMGVLQKQLNSVLSKHGCETVKLGNGAGEEEVKTKEGKDISDIDTSKHCGPSNLQGCPAGQNCYLIVREGMVVGSSVSSSSRYCKCANPDDKPRGARDVGLGSDLCATEQMKNGAGFSSNTRTTNLDGSQTEKTVDPLADVASTIVDCVSDLWNGKIEGQCAQKILGNAFSWAYFAEQTLKGCPSVTAEERTAVVAEGLKADAYIGELVTVENIQGANGEIWEKCNDPDKDGKKNCELILIDTADGTITSLSGNTVGCMPLPFKLYEARSCLFCPLFNVIYNAIQQAATKAYATLAKPLSTLLLIGLAIWIALMVLANVSAMTKQDAPKFLTDLFKNSFKVVVVFILLRYSSIIYDIIIGPLLKAGFDFGASFLDSSGDYMSKCKSRLEYSSSIVGILPSYIYTTLLCFIEAVQFELATTQAIGSSLMCIARNAGAENLAVFARALPDFGMLFQGFLIWVIAFIISIAFGFYLIDATIQLGIFGILLPFLLMCYPFKITHGYFATGVGVFVNSWFIFVFMGLVTNLTIGLIGQGATGGKGNMKTIEDAINGNDITTLKNLLDIGFAGFVVLIACCVFAVKLMQKVQELAGTFSGGGLNLGIGSKVGGLAASGVTNSAKWAWSRGVVQGGKSVVNARIFGKDGEEKSIMDGVRAARNKVGRGVGKIAQWAPRKIGRFAGKLAGRKRRDSSEAE